MSNGGAFVLGAVAGGLLGALAVRLLTEPSDCCHRVAMGVRAEVGEALGPAAQGVGDFLGLWRVTPGLLSFFGVPA